MTAYPTSRKLLPNDGGRRSAHRLVVLVPNQDVDAIRFSRAIRSISVPETTDVLLVTAVNSVEAELAARRRLATIASQVRDIDFKVEVRIVWNGSWIAPQKRRFSRIRRPAPSCRALPFRPSAAPDPEDRQKIQHAACWFPRRLSGDRNACSVRCLPGPDSRSQKSFLRYSPFDRK